MAYVRSKVTRKEDKSYSHKWKFTKPLHLGLIVTALGVSISPTYSQKISPTRMSLKTRLSIVRDMKKGEARPMGAPNVIWAERARVNLGNSPGNFRSILPWAQVFAGPGNTESNVAIQIRDLRAMILYKGNKKWVLSKPFICVSGAYYLTTYANDGHSNDPIHNPSAKTCTVNAKVGQALHFWSSAGRTPLTSDQIVGIIVIADARVLPRQASLKPQFLMSVGADYWLDQSSRWDNYKTNGDAGIGRFKWISSRWRLFSMTTLSPEEMKSTPSAVEPYSG